LAKSDPGKASWQRDLSVSYDKVRDVLVVQGNTEHYNSAATASLLTSASQSWIRATLELPLAAVSMRAWIAAWGPPRHTEARLVDLNPAVKA
jgi:hypothetical protein